MNSILIMQSKDTALLNRYHYIGIKKLTQKGSIGMITVVGCVICNKNKILMIQQGKNHIRGLWNFPSGKLEKNERIVDAVVREVEEETGYKVELSGLIGIYNFFSEANEQIIMVCYVGKVKGGNLEHDNEEIIDAKWLSTSEISQLRDEELRNHSLIRKIINDLEDKSLIPIDIINDLF
ncbi:NUDIX hydrolase [Alkaliphilus transvaalensis]|uniref:NUDIX hydrolase n=1 Tax=Alkaliphilus transvaalensis TaxID=114628 RepID=UPI000683EBDC|nr:NUDIX domain-containing protein [Alkaliphilus transvaalensis]